MAFLFTSLAWVVERRRVILRLPSSLRRQDNSFTQSHRLFQPVIACAFSSSVRLVVRLDSTSHTMNVLISCHTDQTNVSEQLQKAFARQTFSCHTIDESTPDSLSARANLVRWCDVFVVIISRSYQRTSFCMETINYAKDVRKPAIAVLAEPEFQPYGALGAISASAIRYVVLDRDGISHNVVAELSNTISAQQSKKKTTKGVIDPAKVRARP